MINKVFKYSLLILLPLSLLACGGGGSDDDDDEFFGAAIVSVSASPSTFDTADRTEINCRVSEVTDTGIILKFRFPVETTYVEDSATVTANGVRTFITPDFYEMDEDGDYYYLVFFLAQNDFGREIKGQVKFQLTGEDELEKGSVEVDADVDDPLVENSDEFDFENPEFATESEASIVVTS